MSAPHSYSDALLELMRAQAAYSSSFSPSDAKWVQEAKAKVDAAMKKGKK